MKFRLVKLAKLSGAKTKIYSVIVEDDSLSLFERFLEENNESHHTELLEILTRIRSISQKEGAKEYFFKRGEGRLGDGVRTLIGVLLVLWRSRGRLCIPLQNDV